MANRQGGQVVIFNEAKTKVLLIKREDFRIWVPPGGSMDDGETPMETAAREAWEETGYEVTIDHYLGEYRRPQIGNAVIHAFVGYVTGGDGSNHSWESLEVEWFDVDALPKRTFSHAREVIEDARFSTELPVKKVQYLPTWQMWLFFVGIRVRNLRNWWLGR